MSTFLSNIFNFPSNSSRVHPIRTNSIPVVISHHEPSKDFLPQSSQSSQSPPRPPTPTLHPYCSVCYRDITKMRPEFCNKCQCKLLFCKQCIMRWVVTNHNSCPTCRKQIFAPKTTERIKHIHSIYAHNKVEPTETSVNNLVQFFENIEAKNRNINKLNRISKLCRTLLSSQPANFTNIPSSHNSLPPRSTLNRNNHQQQILNNARAQAESQPQRTQDNRTSPTNIVLPGSVPI